MTSEPHNQPALRPRYASDGRLIGYDVGNLTRQTVDLSDVVLSDTEPLDPAAKPQPWLNWTLGFISGAALTATFWMLTLMFFEVCVRA